jgi:4-hydroxybenzoate polyprenyltransferase
VSLIGRLRLGVAVARPAVLLMLATYAASGVAAAGGDLRSVVAMLPALGVVAAFLVFSVALNDLADLEIDRVNLAGCADRPLVVGAARRAHMVGTAAGAAVVALVVAAFVGWAALGVTGAGLVVSAAYSLPPIGLSGRGAVASLVLPACYVAVPFLVGVFSTSASIGPANVVLLAGLYVGFIGRILLKDFRDVRGDALFGKRTFLVRHGRAPTCRFAAAGWTGGTALTLFAGSMRAHTNLGLYVSYGVALVAVLALLVALSRDRGPRRDELIISTIAIVGRGSLLALLAALSMASQPSAVVSGVITGISFVTAGQAYEMLRRGPVMRRTVPAGWVASTTSPEPVPAPTT